MGRRASAMHGAKHVEIKRPHTCVNAAHCDHNVRAFHNLHKGAGVEHSGTNGQWVGAKGRLRACTFECEGP